MMKSNYIFTITTGNSGRGRFEKNSVAQGVCSGGPYIMLVVYIHCQLAHGFVSTHAPVNNKPIRASPPVHFNGVCQRANLEWAGHLPGSGPAMVASGPGLAAGNGTHKALSKGGIWHPPFHPMFGENRRLVTNEPVGLAKKPDIEACSRMGIRPI